jgi:hypothetical protein
VWHNLTAMNMFPLNVLSQSVSTFQIAGRVGVDLLGLLLPVRPKTKSKGIRLCSSTKLAGSSHLQTLFDQHGQASVSLSFLRDHLLVARPRGQFFSTDELALKGLRREDDQWSIDVIITHRENQDGEPAPRDLYVVLQIDPGRRPVRSLILQFSGQTRDFYGKETLLSRPIAPVERIKFTN